MKAEPVSVHFEFSKHSDAPEWQKYLEAAHRKLEIAKFHFDQFMALGIDPFFVIPPNPNSAPQIPMQAHFEGLLISCMAAVDQISYAVRQALGSEFIARSNELTAVAFQKLGDELPKLAVWFDEPIGVDVRRLRTRMVHYSYTKHFSGFTWIVEIGNPKYQGSRYLIEYCQNVSDYSETLKTFLPDIQVTLSKWASHTNRDAT